MWDKELEIWKLFKMERKELWMKSGLQFQTTEIRFLTIGWLLHVSGMHSVFPWKTRVVWEQFLMIVEGSEALENVMLKKQAHKNLILCLSPKMLITITHWSIKKLKPYCCFNMIGFSRAFPEKVCTQEFTLYLTSMLILNNIKIDISFQTVFNL